MKCKLCKNEFIEDGFCYLCSLLTKDNKVFELEEENANLRDALMEIITHVGVLVASEERDAHILKVAQKALRKLENG